jgi:hypothetical protein
MKSQPGATPEQTALMERLFANQKPAMSCVISTHLENGWLVAGNGTEGAGKMLGPLLIAPVAVAAGIALPAFTQISARGKETNL